MTGPERVGKPQTQPGQRRKRPMKSRGPTNSNRHKGVWINWWSGLDLRTVDTGSPMMAMRLGCPAKELKHANSTSWKEGVRTVP